jgi:hypothetical protein
MHQGQRQLWFDQDPEKTIIMPPRNTLEGCELGSEGLRLSALGLGWMFLSGVYGESKDEEAVSPIRYALDQAWPARFR